MKQKKLICHFRLGSLLTLILLMFFSCEKENFHEEEVDANDSKLFKEIEFSDFKKTVQANNLHGSQFDKISELHQNQNINGAVKSATQEFIISIDSTEVLMAEMDGITSYTFHVITTDSSKTTNYVFAFDENNNTDEYYLTYQPDGFSTIFIPESMVGTMAKSGGSVWCPISEERLVCTCAGHTADQCGGCDGWETVTVITGNEYCGPALGEGSGGGGSGSDSGGGDGDGSGGGGTGSGGGNDLPIDGPIVTKPVKPVPPTPDCAELTKNEDDPFYNQFMQDLKTAAVNETVEKGFNTLYFPATATEPVVETNVFPPRLFIGTAHNVTLPLHLNRKVASHSHPDSSADALKVFAPMDIVVLGELLYIQQNNPNSPLNVSQLAMNLVTASGTFSLKVDSSNISSLIDFYLKYPLTITDQNGNKVPNPNSDFDLYLDVNREYKDNIKPTLSNSVQIKNFLNFLKNQNIGATPYEKNEETGVWEKLSVDSNGTLNRTPC